MRPVTALTTLVACVLLLAVPATSAWANATDDRIINECANSATGAVTGSYTKAQLQHALNNLQGDVLEYSGCPDAIRQALHAGDGGGGNDGGGGGTNGTGTAGGGFGTTSGAGGTPGGTAVPDTPPPAGAEQPVDVAGAAVAPGALPEIGKDSHRLPTALLVLLVLVGVAALVPAALTIGRRVVGHRRA